MTGCAGWMTTNTLVATTNQGPMRRRVRQSVGGCIITAIDATHTFAVDEKQRCCETKNATHSSLLLALVLVELQNMCKKINSKMLERPNICYIF